MPFRYGPSRQTYLITAGFWHDKLELACPDLPEKARARRSSRLLSGCTARRRARRRLPGAGDRARRRAALFVEKAAGPHAPKRTGPTTASVATKTLKDWESMLAWSRSLGESNPQAEKRFRHYREKDRPIDRFLSGHHANSPASMTRPPRGRSAQSETDLPSPPTRTRLEMRSGRNEANLPLATSTPPQ